MSLLNSTLHSHNIMWYYRNLSCYSDGWQLNWWGSLFHRNKHWNTFFPIPKRMVIGYFENVHRCPKGMPWPFSMIIAFVVFLAPFPLSNLSTGKEYHWIPCRGISNVILTYLALLVIPLFNDSTQQNDWGRFPEGSTPTVIKHGFAELDLFRIAMSKCY